MTTGFRDEDEHHIQRDEQGNRVEDREHDVGELRLRTVSSWRFQTGPRELSGRVKQLTPEEYEEKRKAEEEAKAKAKAASR